MKNGIKIIILIIILAQVNFAQFDGKKVKWIRVGSLHQYFLNVGAEYEMGRSDRAEQQIDGLRWPAQNLFQDNLAAKALWIGTKDYYDRELGKEVPHKVVSVGTRTYDANKEIMPVEFKMIGRFNHPTVIVDGVKATDNDLNDRIDEVDESIPCDRIIVNKLNSYIGISITRKILGYSQQYNDNYFIYEYTFKNTGIIDYKGTIEKKTLKDVYFYFQYRYAFANEAAQKGWIANYNITWGRNTVNDVIGEDPADPNFKMRALMAWYGPHSQSMASDDWGAPDPVTGRALAAVQYVGCATLHCDKSPTDNSDDLYQPRTTWYIGSDTGPQKRDQFNPQYMDLKYAEMEKGHPKKSHAEEIGNGYADIWGTDAGGYSQGQGFGPFTLNYGDSIKIVLAEGVSGLSREKNLEVVKKWFNNEGPFILPDGNETKNADEYKRKWVQSGRDSLIKTFERAIENYKAGYQIPLPPPPPDKFEVKSGGDRIQLSWSDNADSWPNFDGYEVYRAVGKPDTTYEKIFSCNKGTVEHSFDDVTAQRGFNYYYYVVTKDDGSTNNIEQGKPLKSSMFYTVTNKPAFLRRPAHNHLSEIRIVPNPYNIRARSLQFGSESKDRIAIYGLPKFCTVKIFTERGDLVKTINHTDGSGDELWDSKTEYGQVITSGIYIIYVEVSKDIKDDNGNIILRKGDSTYEKFIVIR